MILTTRAAGLAMCVSLLSPVSTANALQPAPATAQGTDCSSCSYPDAPSSRPSRPPGSGTQSGGSGANAGQVLGAVVGAMEELQRVNNQIDAENRAIRARREESERIERERSAARNRDLSGTWQQWEREGAQSVQSGQPSQNNAQSSGNPWGQGAAFQPKDPSVDYSGESCAYFTKSSTDGATFTRYYADGAFVVYGELAYECVNRRWVKKGPARIFSNSQRYEASVLEGTSDGQ